MVAATCNPNYLGGWDRTIAQTQDVEVAVSWDHAIALQPGWQRKKNLKSISPLFENETASYFSQVNVIQQKWQCEDLVPLESYNTAIAICTYLG